MKSNKITEKQIHDISRLCHIFVFISSSPEHWSDKLKNMSPVDLGLINEVTNNPDPIIKEIKEKLDIPPSTLTSSINRLEKKGLIRREISTKDRRSYELQLTDKGEEIQSEHLKVDRMAARKLLESLDSNKDRDEFIRLLSIIIEHIN